MKRLLSLFIFVFAIVLLVGCGGKTGPAKIEGKDKVYVRLGDPEFNIKAGLKALDEVKGDVIEKVTADKDVDVNTAGEYVVTFSVKASNGELATLTVTFVVAPVTLSGADDAKVVLGSYRFDPLNQVYAVDPVDGRITAANKIKAEINFTIKKVGSDEVLEEINTKELGEYEITYEVTYKGSRSTIVRKVSIVDQILWSGVGEVEREIGAEFVPLQGVKALQPVKDEEGNPTTRDISQFIRVVSNNVDSSKPGSYEVVYKLLDPTSFNQEDPDYDPTDPTKDPDPAVYLKENGEDIEIVRIVNIVNRIVLMGAGNTTITKGSAFDPKKDVTARDSVGPIDASKITVIGTVDVTVEKSYELTYIVIGSFDTEYVQKRIVTVIPPLTGKVDIYFMSGDLRENDPYNKNFLGSYVTEKQRLQDAAEEKYNVKIHYVPYPANASWGPARIEAMINANMDGAPLADIYYHISSDWIPQLAKGGAIGAVDDLIAPGAYGEAVPQNVRDASKYAKKVYGFSPSSLGIESGLYYNSELAAKIGLPNPTDMYLAGNWTWSTFKDWAIKAKKLISEEESVIGGTIGQYVENLVPLNGGDFIDETRGRVLFTNDAAMQTYEYIKGLYDEKLFEASPAIDAGSVAWKTGKVIFHPGHFWFINADNRWGGDNLSFTLGYVPFPMNDDYKASGKPYRSPVFGPSFPVMAGGMTKERQELVFKVWWDMQRKPATPEIAEEEYRILLKSRFDKDSYVEAYISVSDSAYRTVIDGLGISKWSDGGFYTNIIRGIRDGDYDTRLREILPAYQEALRRYLEA